MYKANSPFKGEIEKLEERIAAAPLSVPSFLPASKARSYCKHCGILLEEGDERRLCNLCSFSDQAAIEYLYKIRVDEEANPRDGESDINHLIRTSEQGRRWKMNALIEFDCCEVCGKTEHLHVHHRIPLFAIIRQKGIETLQQAGRCKLLWAPQNAEVLCPYCHASRHLDIENLILSHDEDSKLAYDTRKCCERGETYGSMQA